MTIIPPLSPASLLNLRPMPRRRGRFLRASVSALAIGGGMGAAGSAGADPCTGDTTTLTCTYTDADELNVIDLSGTGLETVEITNDATLNAQLLTDNGNGFGPWPTHRLGRDMRQVARTIVGRSALNQERQIFFVSRGVRRPSKRAILRGVSNCCERTAKVAMN